ncbi:hypothetical protein BDV96DRAFT_645199 [Lophiotrema nucula]|uniref:Thioesterase-like superfamily-domain-containing protein n=1 Tax=Lophiotrema nucula TaxID=690887 RepID=A0A6A5ZBE3_9PLEO|nr:hypothetical protein BDV96DRAFT_645199 [Lophiotrema nucula]
MPSPFLKPLSASSNLHPTAPTPYTALRSAAVEAAVAQGYDFDSLTEIPVDWSADQDPNAHVSNPVYARYASAGNMRLFESFAEALGDRFVGMVRGKGVGPVLKGYQYDLKRMCSYPDSVLVGNRLSDVKCDRYFTTTTIWSLRQQAVVAECTGWVVFVNFASGKPVDLTAAGDPYDKLHALILRKAQEAKRRKDTWDQEQAAKKKSSKF